MNKVFNALCSGGVSTETQIKITACDSSMQSFFFHQEMKKIISAVSTLEYLINCLYKENVNLVELKQNTTYSV